MKNWMKLFVVWAAAFGLYAFARIEGSIVASTLWWSFAVLTVYWTLFMTYPVTAANVVRRVTTKRLVSGQTMDVELRIERKYPFLIGMVTLEERLPQRLTDEDKTIVVPVDRFFRQAEVVHYEVEAIKRGIHVFDRTVLHVRDVFGLFDRKRTLRLETVVEVSPAELPFDLPRDEHVGGRGEQYRQMRTYTEVANTTSGVREYAAGDRIGRIDWKASARRGNLMTKTFDQEQEKKLSLVFVPAVSAGYEEAFERSLSLLVGAIRQLERKNLPFELYVIEEQVRLFHLPDQSAEVGHYLLTATPEAEGRLVERVKQKLPQQTGDLILISPFETTSIRELMHETQGSYHLYTAVNEVTV
ncbi:DUF58 domain-containing protein [Exiguobacterium sp. SRB7LM]|uniref:DUF58 domain-containing protein n=1 Tax=Exiguobacterium sp. SRB7LM TaxID=2608401 RepID=UPI0018C38C8A|nr:DUF58 domain-containing protein [Exiguobacterium sp. SRB7LM]MBG0918452.1 DUF58 domain-containing protein [Exiguobacterium sp. SRB7LM]